MNSRIVDTLATTAAGIEGSTYPKVFIGSAH